MHLSRPQSESTAASDAERGSTGSLRFIDLGRMAYADAYARQKAAQDALIAARQISEPGAADGHADDAAPMTVFFVEHDPPVITVSRRKTARAHLTATPAELAAAGVDVAETDRGGDITYHGPGQLVVYPVLDLNRLGLRLHGYMRMLEQIVIDVLGRFDIVGERDDSATGVWVPPRASTGNATPGSPAKICAMGVRISRWVTLHGLALNVTTNLDHFRLIVPCGLTGRPVTSMQQLLSDACPTMVQVRSAMREQFDQAVNQHMRST